MTCKSKFPHVRYNWKLICKFSYSILQRCKCVYNKMCIRKTRLFNFKFVLWIIYNSVLWSTHVKHIVKTQLNISLQHHIQCDSMPPIHSGVVLQHIENVYTTDENVNLCTFYGIREPCIFMYGTKEHSLLKFWWDLKFSRRWKLRSCSGLHHRIVWYHNPKDHIFNNIPIENKIPALDENLNVPLTNRAGNMRNMTHLYRPINS
jgi:hypothetical protein